jgi:hypothetical protein
MTCQSLAIWGQKASIWLRQKGVIDNKRFQKFQAKFEPRELARWEYL